MFEDICNNSMMRSEEAAIERKRLAMQAGVTPNDVWAAGQRGNSLDINVVKELLNNRFTAEDLRSKNFENSVVILAEAYRRIPNITTEERRFRERTWADIAGLASCGRWTHKKVGIRIQKELVAASLMSADGSNPLVGLTATSAILTQKNIVEANNNSDENRKQEPRKKIFGLI